MVEYNKRKINEVKKNKGVWEKEFTWLPSERHPVIGVGETVRENKMEAKK